MSPANNDTESGSLILAAEDCDPKEFFALHFFTQHDDRIISKLIGHGPVLLKGGRGSGKSALMIAASMKVAPHVPESPVLGIYISLRHLELLRSKDKEYEEFFCKLLAEQIIEVAGQLDLSLEINPNVSSLQQALSKLAELSKKRVVIFFDDAAHLGREASLAEFFDIFRTLSSSSVSCKATIYPGVTRFGIRFDVYNDATVLDLSRSANQEDLTHQFSEIMRIRYPDSFADEHFGSITREAVAGFLGRSVLGNMRAFIFACNTLNELRGDKQVGLNEMGATLVSLASNYYWPLLEELEPKLGIYTPLIPVANNVATIIFQAGAKDSRTSILVLREIREKLAKAFEILEYAGFISIRDASRGMKSGGRGVRYAICLCNLLESISGSRLTKILFESWSANETDSIELHKASELNKLFLPKPKADEELAILGVDISKLQKSRAYPYGLTGSKIQILRENGITTIGELANSSDETLEAIPTIGSAAVKRIRNVLGQAIWM